MEKFHFDAFEDMVAFKKKLSVVTFDKDEWLSSTCTCEAYLKTYICCHLVAVADYEDVHDVNPEAKSQKPDLPKQRKAGRRKKASKALSKE